MPFCFKLRGRKVGSEMPRPNWLVMLNRQSPVSQTKPAGASGTSRRQGNQLCSRIISPWAQQVLVMGPRKS